MSESIASLLVNSDKYSLTTTAGEQLHADFADKRFVLLQNFYQGSGLEFLRREAERLAKRAIRRNFKMTETDETSRLMSTLNGDAIDEISSLIPSLYTDPHLHQFLSAIAGERVYAVQDMGEKYVLNILHQKDDTHGAHVDTYAYALITVIEAPNEGDGGCLELVPGVIDQEEIDGPNVVRLWPKPGDCIFLTTDDTIHRVAPLIRSSVRRLVIASAFANKKTLNQVSYSSKKLYG
jgi:hypothetical protein